VLVCARPMSILADHLWRLSQDTDIAVHGPPNLLYAKPRRDLGYTSRAVRRPVAVTNGVDPLEEVSYSCKQQWRPQSIGREDV
jgi:hypothetical protein